MKLHEKNPVNGHCQILLRHQEGIRESTGQKWSIVTPVGRDITRNQINRSERPSCVCFGILKC